MILVSHDDKYVYPACETSLQYRPGTRPTTKRLENTPDGRRTAHSWA